MGRISGLNQGELGFLALVLFFPSLYFPAPLPTGFSDTWEISFLQAPWSLAVRLGFGEEKPWLGLEFF